MAHASRQSSYLIVSVGAFLQVVAGWWDVFSHLLFGSADPWWNPAHLLLYSAVAIAIFGVWRGLHVDPRPHAASFGPVGFVNIAGLKLAGVGCVIELVAGTWNEVVHRIIRGEPRIPPAHALLTVGMLTVSLGVVIGLTIEYGMIKREMIVASTARLAAVACCIILTFSAIWLAAAGVFIYVAGVMQSSPSNSIIAFFLALVVTLVLVPLKRVLPRIGSGFAISVVFNVIAFMLLVGYAGYPAYIPWGVLVVALFEFALALLRKRIGFKRATLLSALGIGLLFGITYYPFTLYLFPWSLALQPLTIFPLIGSVSGALLGNRVYTGLTSLVLGDVLGSL